MRAGWFAALALLLAACSGAPKKPVPPPVAAPVPAPAGVPPECDGASPYPPAQEDPSKRGDYVAGGLFRPGERDWVPEDIPLIECIPEPEVVHEPRSPVGNRSPYQVLGRTYHVLDTAEGYVETGIASYYGGKFHGRRTSNQEVYDMYAFTAAHRTLPLPSYARVTNLENGRSVVVRVNDRGPFHEGRLIDLSYAAAVRLGIHRQGTGRVEVRGLVPGREPVLARAGAPARAPASDAASRSPMDSLVESLPANAVAGTARATGGEGEWRFDMSRDGKVMTADEFDAWMAARQVRVATGRPGTPAPAAAAPGPGPAAAPAAPSTRPGAAQPAPATPGTRGGVVLQVAAFASRTNAEHALAMLQRAGLDPVRLQDGVSGGRPVWRLRVGPVAESAVPELASRISGLGFGTPRIVRD